VGEDYLLPHSNPDSRERNDEGAGLNAWGPRSLCRMVSGHLVDKRVGIRDGVGFGASMRLHETVLERQPSLVDELVAAGYDPETLVLSIRRKGAPAAPVEVPDGMLTRMEDAQSALAILATAIDAFEETKDVYVLDQAERDALRTSVSDAQGAVDRAMGLLTGAEGVEGVEETAVRADAAGGASVPLPVQGGAAVAFGRDAFDRVMILRWEKDDAEPTVDDGLYLHLYDKETRVGSVYERGNGTFRWHCVPSDWRDSESGLQEAKDALVANYAQHYAHEARELVRSALPKSPEAVPEA
jgi:hypothetical protein